MFRSSAVVRSVIASEVCGGRSLDKCWCLCMWVHTCVSAALCLSVCDDAMTLVIFVPSQSDTLTMLCVVWLTSASDMTSVLCVELCTSAGDTSFFLTVIQLCHPPVLQWNNNNNDEFICRAWVKYPQMCLWQHTNNSILLSAQMSAVTTNIGRYLLPFTFSFGVDYVQCWSHPSIVAQCATPT